MHKNPDAGEIKRILEESRNVAVVGLSESPYRTSHAIASALRRELSARSGPIETTTTSPSPVDALSRNASSTAFASNAFSAPSPERSRRLLPGSIRLCAVASGTSFTQTAIFIAEDSNGAPLPL